jgi:hypothetical protein
MDSLKVNSGPPFSAMNFWPFSSNSTTITEPAGPGPASLYRPIRPSRESLKMPR